MVAKVVDDQVMRTEDGVPLKVALKRAERSRNLKALALVAPLFLFILLTFAAPIGLLLYRAIYDPDLMNNLPAGLIASSTVMQAQSPERVIDALLIGVDLGPNLSITGSLATILWLSAIRREGEDVSFMKFLKVGVLVMVPALVLALGARVLIS